MPDIFEEVDEALRREKIAGIWSRHKVLILIALAGIVAGAGFFSGYQNWAKKKAEADTDAFLTAQKSENRATALETFAQSHSGDLRALALFDAAQAYMEQSSEGKTSAPDNNATYGLYRKIAEDPGISKIHRDRARILAAQILAQETTNAAEKTKDPQNATLALSEMETILGEKDNVWAPQARMAAALLTAYALNDPARARTYLEGLIAANNALNVPMSLQRLAQRLDHTLSLRTTAPAPSRKEPANPGNAPEESPAAGDSTARPSAPTQNPTGKEPTP